ncbi:MAG: CoA protein activase [Chloroflexi bacterium]|nr:CoA protein activase [Chloroflexota bacterium]MCL5075156.1 CoA protein activase [Chloroflexota bacterium]
MKVSFPRMGNIWVALKTLFTKAGVETIVPPPTSKRTLSLGTKYSPEWMCMPFKVNLGNYIEALELGADTLLGVGGPGLCRLGYYHKLHESILRDLGFNFEMLCFDWQEKQIVGLAEFLKRLLGHRSWMTIIGDIKYGLSQLFLLDDLERHTHYLRARERRKGETSKVWSTAPQRICAAHGPAELKKAKKEILAEFAAIELEPNFQPLRVGILGEFFMAMESFCNMNLEETLGNMGVEVTRAAFISDWAKIWLFLEALGLSHGQKVKRAASPYLKRDVSGDAMQSLGETVLHSQEGFHGIIHLQPFTCMPEIIAQNMLPQVSRDHDIPVLSIILDEQMGEAGLRTRLEAFVDLMARRQAQRRAHR